MLATSLVALDSTIIATAVLTITDQLGGFAQFPWLFSIYLLAQAVTVPIYGKLADMLGRKPVMLFGIAVFALGSMLCGLATSMVALIAFRAVQGIGAGAVAPMSMTIAGDVYTVAERAKVQGYLASVWAASSVLGPVLGGVFAEYVSWRWIFLINLPLAALAAWMLARHFTERATRQTHRIDYLGAALLTVVRARSFSPCSRAGTPGPGVRRRVWRSSAAGRWRSCCSAWSSVGPPIRFCRCGFSPGAWWWRAVRCRYSSAR